MKVSIIVIVLALLIGFGMYFTVIKEKSEKIEAKRKEFDDLEEEPGISTKAKLEDEIDKLRKELEGS